MLRHGHAPHYKKYVTNWATLLTKSDPSCRAEEESSEHHQLHKITHNIAAKMTNGTYTFNEMHSSATRGRESDPSAVLQRHPRDVTGRDP